jgi:hypothetical protein
MPLSRHFYSLDEVQAALLYTTSRNNVTEALFWCQEILLSNSIGEAISTLFQSWLWNTGSLRLKWLIDAYKTLASEEINKDDILLATYRLANIHHTNRDNSLWNILILNSHNPNVIPDSVTRKTPSVIPSDDAKELYFIRSIFQGKANSAWWISRYIDNERVWILLYWFAEHIYTNFQKEYYDCFEALQNYQSLLGYKSDEYDIIVRCKAIIILCIQPYKQEESFRSQINEIDKYNLQILNELEASIGRKEYRVYQIPTSCLYGITLRGRSKWTQNTYSQLYNIEKYLIGCPFWDEVLTNYADVDNNGNIKWKSDDKMEEFYEQYFPDDIPDEWSKKDQQKSHGDGLLGPNNKPNICKFSRIFMSKMPYFAWNTTKLVNKYLESIDIPDCSYERIIQLYTTPISLTKEDLKKLEPVHKIKIV